MTLHDTTHLQNSQNKIAEVVEQNQRQIAKYERRINYAGKVFNLSSIVTKASAVATTGVGLYNLISGNNLFDFPMSIPLSGLGLSIATNLASQLYVSHYQRKIFESQDNLSELGREIALRNKR